MRSATSCSPRHEAGLTEAVKARSQSACGARLGVSTSQTCPGDGCPPAGPVVPENEARRIAPQSRDHSKPKQSRNRGFPPSSQWGSPVGPQMRGFCIGALQKNLLVIPASRAHILITSGRVLLPFARGSVPLWRLALTGTSIQTQPDRFDPAFLFSRRQCSRRYGDM